MNLHKKKILLILTLFSASHAGATTTLAGAVLNSWTQRGLRVTDRSLDFAMNGPGFFKLLSSDSEAHYTRYGEFFVDSDGFVAHRPSGYRLVFLDDTKNEVTLNLNDISTSPVRAIHVSNDGLVTFSDLKGQSQPQIHVAITLFDDAYKLSISGPHVLIDALNQESLTTTPKKDGAGQLFSSSLEVLPKDKYGIILKPRTCNGGHSFDRSSYSNDGDLLRAWVASSCGFEYRIDSDKVTVENGHLMSIQDLTQLTKKLGIKICQELDVANSWDTPWERDITGSYKRDIFTTLIRTLISENCRSPQENN